MAELDWIGRNAADDNDPSYRDYTATNIAKNLTQSQIDAAINLEYNKYADKTYVNQQDLLNATQKYVDDRDALNILATLKDQPNGVAGLDSLGYMSRSHIPAADTQRFPRVFWSPAVASYNAAAVTANATTPEATVYTCSVSDPLYNAAGVSNQYKLVVHGSVETWTDTDGVTPVINVRAGTASGQIVARGFGGQTSKAWFGGDYFTRNTQLNASLGGPSYWDERLMPVPGITNPGGNPYCDGTEARWNLDPHGTPAAPTPNGQRHKRFFLKAGADKTTTDDYQEIVATVGAVLCVAGSPFGYPAGNWFVGRANEDLTQYCAFRVTSDTVIFYICVGSEVEMARAAMTHATGDTLTARFGTSGGKRVFQFLKTTAAGVTTTVLTYTDSRVYSPGEQNMGSFNRRWGFGMEAGLNDSFFGGVQWQVTPASYTQVLCNDLPPTSTGLFRVPAVVRPTALSLQSSRSGAVTLYVTVSRSTAAGSVSAGTYKPNLRVEAVPA